MWDSAPSSYPFPGNHHIIMILPVAIIVGLEKVVTWLPQEDGLWS